MRIKNQTKLNVALSIWDKFHSAGLRIQLVQESYQYPFSNLKIMHLHLLQFLEPCIFKREN